MKTKMILSEYDEMKPVFERLRDYVDHKLEVLAKENTIPLMARTGRVKTRESLNGKIIKKQDKYNSLMDITDILGFRLICYFSKDVDKIAALIAKEFNINWNESIDKRAVLEPTVFGYLSLHYICSLPDNGDYPEEFSGLQFEFQIRSTLQHVWAEIEHDLGYKSQFGIPKEVRREFSRVAGLLEVADECFDSIRENVNNYTQEVVEKIEADEADQIALNLVSLREYMTHSKRMRAFFNATSEACHVEVQMIDPQSYCKQLDFLGIKTLGDLNEFVKRNEEKAIKMAVDTLSVTDLDILSSNAMLRFICHTELKYGDYDETTIEEFLMLSMSNQERAKKLAKRLSKR